MKKSKLNLTYSDMYEAYKNKYELSKQEYEVIINLCNSLFMEAIIETGYFLRIPHRLGTISILKTRPKSKPLDLNYYMQTGEKIYHKNRHSQGFIAGFKWNKSSRNAVITNRASFEFLPVRANKQKLAKAIKEKNTIFKYMDYDRTLRNN